MNEKMKYIYAALIIAFIALTSIGAFTVNAFSFKPPKTLSAEFLQGSWANPEYGVNYGFMGKNTMLISDSIEGEEYHYIIKDDTIIFRRLIDEGLGYTEFDTMTYKVLDEDSIELYYQRLKLKLVREKRKDITP